MSEKEKHFWDKNIKSGNKNLWINKLKWKLRLIPNPKAKTIKTARDFDLNIKIGWIYKAAYILVALMILEAAIGVVRSSVYLIYPNYGNNTQIIRDFLVELGAK